MLDQALQMLADNTLNKLTQVKGDLFVFESFGKLYECDAGNLKVVAALMYTLRETTDPELESSVRRHLERLTPPFDIQDYIGFKKDDELLSTVSAGKPLYVRSSELSLIAYDKEWAIIQSPSGEWFHVDRRVFE